MATSQTAAAGDTGYFSDSSVIRLVMRERAVALSGPRALLMQAAHPLAVAGLLAHSDSLDDPYIRLARTAQVMDTITFGPRAEADRLTAQVRAMHGRVRGRLPEASGIYPAGTPYHADDPALLLWILYSLIDSATVLYRTYVGRLGRRRRAALWEDYKVVGRLFGLADGELPAGLDDLEDYGHAMLTGDELHVGDWARRRARKIVLAPPVPALVRPVLETVNFITIALAARPDPRRIRIPAAAAAGCEPCARGAGALSIRRGLLPVLPDHLRLMPAARAAA